MQTQYAAYGLVQRGPKAFTTFGSNSVAYPEALAGSCTRNPATGALSGSIGTTCFGTPSEPGDQIDTHEFTQGLINPLTRGNVYMRASYDLTPGHGSLRHPDLFGRSHREHPGPGQFRQIRLHPLR